MSGGEAKDCSGGVPMCSRCSHILITSNGFHRPPHRLPAYRPPTDRKDSSICLEDESEQCVFRRPGTGYSPDVIAELCFNRGLSCDRFAAVERRPNNLGNAYCSIGIRHNTGRG